MSTIESHSEIKITVTLTLTEIEARALEGMTAYSVSSFLKGYYKMLGRSYVEPYEDGFRSLFKTIKSQIPQHLRRIDNARKIFNGGIL